MLDHLKWSYSAACELCTQVFWQWDNYGMTLQSWKTNQMWPSIEMQGTLKTVTEDTPWWQEITLPILGTLKHLEVALSVFCWMDKLRHLMYYWKFLNLPNGSLICWGDVTPPLATSLSAVMTFCQTCSIIGLLCPIEQSVHTLLAI